MTYTPLIAAAMLLYLFEAVASIEVGRESSKHIDFYSGPRISYNKARKAMSYLYLACGLGLTAFKVALTAGWLP